jgi:hypothetical protein
VAQFFALAELALIMRDESFIARLARWQRSELLSMLITVLGWALFVISFFLPATNVVERGGTLAGTPLIGWDAAVTSLALIGAQPLILVIEPKSLIFLFVPLINLLVLVSPAIALRAPEGAFWLAVVFVPTGLLLLTMPKILEGEVFVGYYLWCISFFVVSAGCIAISLSATAVLDDS